jgi:hypothetical protein
MMGNHYQEKDIYSLIYLKQIILNEVDSGGTPTDSQTVSPPYEIILPQNIIFGQISFPSL